MQDAGVVGAHADAHDHVTDLRHRRIGEDAFDVPLRATEDRAGNRGQRADRTHQNARIARGVPKRRATRDQVDAGRDHRCRMDQGRNGRRAFHRVGQPGVQRHLRRLRRAADEQTEAHREQLARRELRDVREHVGVADRADLGDDHEHRVEDAHIADDVDNEGFARCGNRRGAFEVVPDQQVRGEADEAPADQQPDEIIGEHQRQHREDEEIQVGEEPRERFLTGEIADRVDVDQEPDAGDDERPDERDPIPLQAERKLRQPRKERLMRPGGRRRIVPREQRRHERDADERRTDRPREALELRPKRPNQNCARKRQEPDQK